MSDVQLLFTQDTTDAAMTILWRVISREWATGDVAHRRIAAWNDQLDPAEGQAQAVGAFDQAIALVERALAVA